MPLPLPLPLPLPPIAEAEPLDPRPVDQPPTGPDLPEVRPTCGYSPLSTLAPSRGSAVDPTWIGLSVNCVALGEAVGVLEDSESLLRQGTVEWQGGTVSYSVGHAGRLHDARAAILRAVVRDVWRQAPSVPVLFDPYFALSPVIQDVEIKEGWLNVYERYAL